jgi:hypothetical protein
MRRLALGLAAVALAGCGSASTKTVTVTAPTTSTTAATTIAPPTATATVTQTTTTVVQTTPAGPLPIVIIGSYAGVKPATIDFSGDAGNVVTGISWSVWTTSQATGEGASGIQSCVPNCAQGTTTQVPTTIALSNPQGGHFTHLIETRRGQRLVASYSSKASWPLSASGSG